MYWRQNKDDIVSNQSHILISCILFFANMQNLQKGKHSEYKMQLILKRVFSFESFHKFGGKKRPFVKLFNFSTKWKHLPTLMASHYSTFTMSWSQVIKCKARGKESRICEKCAKRKKTQTNTRCGFSRWRRLGEDKTSRGGSDCHQVDQNGRDCPIVPFGSHTHGGLQ